MKWKSIPEISFVLVWALLLGAAANADESVHIPISEPFNGYGTNPIHQIIVGDSSTQIDRVTFSADVYSTEKTYQCCHYDEMNQTWDCGSPNQDDWAFSIRIFRETAAGRKYIAGGNVWYPELGEFAYENQEMFGDEFLGGSLYVDIRYSMANGPDVLCCDSPTDHSCWGREVSPGTFSLPSGVTLFFEGGATPTIATSFGTIRAIYR
jgi:hypothetical protein